MARAPNPAIPPARLAGLLGHPQPPAEPRPVAALEPGATLGLEPGWVPARRPDPVAAQGPQGRPPRAQAPLEPPAADRFATDRFEATRRGRRTARRPPVVSVPGVLRTARVRIPGRTVLALAIVSLAALLVFGARVWLAQAAARPRPIPTSLAVSGQGSPSGLVGRSVPSGFGGGVSPTTTTSELVVHVVGRVAHPGIVRVPAGSRVVDAITAAGGATRSADLSRVNLARLVVDGEQIAVPRPGEVVIGAPGAAAGTAGAMIDLNGADLATLDSLPGVGPVLAQRILDWRAEHGRFTTVDELGEVSGIGDKLLAQLRPKVQV